MKNAFCDREKKYTEQVLHVTWIGVAVNLVLMIIKFFLGTIGNSQALIADAVHTLSDLLTDFAIIFGVYFWSKPADENHPYGHQRIESLVTVLIGTVLAFAAIRISHEALITIKAPNITPPLWIAFFGSVFSIITKEILYRWTISRGRQLKSSAIIANALDHRSDAFSSVMVAIAIAVSAIAPQWMFVDHLGAFVVSIFVLKVAWNILSPALQELIDTGMNERTRHEIETAVLSINGVRSCHGLRTRKSGPGWYVDIHIQVEPDLSVKEGHDIASAVKYRLFDTGRDIIDVLVHVEPFQDCPAGSGT